MVSLIDSRYHKQFIHGISSINGQKFDRPRQSRVCWLSSQEDCFLKEIPLYVCVESYCDDCKCWVQQYKCKKRVEHTYSNIEDFKKAVIDTDVACESPMKIVATFCDGKLKCPAGILMNSKVMDEVSSSMRNDSGPQWYKHKHKCQVNCK